MVTDEDQLTAPGLIRLAGPVAAALVDLAFDRLHLPTLDFGGIHEGQCGAFKFQGGSVAEAARALRVRVDNATSGGSLSDARKLRNIPASFTLSDGSCVEAAKVHMRGDYGSSAAPSYLLMDLHHWTWENGSITAGTSDRATFWVGHLHGRLSSSGNVTLTETRAGVACSKNAFRLNGRFTWYFIPTEEQGRYLTLVDPSGATPSRTEVVADLLCLEFAFGTPLRVDFLVGLANRVAVEAMSVANYLRSGAQQRAPVPDFLFDSGVWVPALFQLLAAKFHSEGPLPLMVAIGPYVDSEADSLDGAYLKAHVGLEALAGRLVGQARPGLLVKDETAWKAWVATLREAIEEHVVDPARVEVIDGKFRSAMFAPSGDRVERALEAHGVAIPKTMTDEIKKRNYPAHGFLMNRGLEYDVERDARRLEIVQTLIAALVACHVGYRGPLRGYDCGADGERPSPEWWPVSLSREDASIRYVAENRISDP